MLAEIELFESTDQTLLDFCLLGWGACEIYKRKVDTHDRLLLACIFDAAARIKKQEDQLVTNSGWFHT
jgi:hypothetical protein